MNSVGRAPLAVAALVAVAGMALLCAAPMQSFTPNLTAGGAGPQMDHWDFSAFPVTWNLNPKTGDNITGSRSVADVMQASFDTWLASPNASINVSRGLDSSVAAEGSSPSNINLLCFVCSDTDFSKDAKTLAVTITTTADRIGESDGHGGQARFVGQLMKADILFNPSTQYSTDGGSGQDLQTVATHEIGHFLGLDHSGVVRAVMFPAASFIRTLSYDDVAGLSTLYPKASPDVPTGSVSGMVHLGSGPVFGAHVYADSTTNAFGFSGNLRKSPIGTLTRPDGSFTIQGLPADSYIITAEPLDGPVNNSDISGYPSAFGQPSVQTNFTTRWH